MLYFSKKYMEIPKIAFFKLMPFACSHEFTSLETTLIAMVPEYSSKSYIMQRKASLRSSFLFSLIVSFFNLMNPDLVESVSQRIK